MDRNAFQSTGHYTKIVILSGIECSQLDLSFLNTFGQLTDLRLENINNIQNCLPTLPPLPNLSKLEIDNCIGMHQLDTTLQTTQMFYNPNHNYTNIPNFPILINGLETFKLSGRKNCVDELLNDEAISRIMNWLDDSSTKTLRELQFEDLKQMTEVPRIVPNPVSFFNVVNKLWMFNTNISSIRAGTIVFSAPVSVFGLVASGLKEIEPGAIQGIFFSLAKLLKCYLYSNNLIIIYGDLIL